MDGGRGRGKLLSLRAAINQYGAEIAADLLRFYGIDIRGLVTGELSPGFCLALIEHLPPESAFKSRLLAEGGIHDPGWDRNTFLLADLLDAIQSLHTSFVRSKVKNPRSIQQPAPYRRPGTREDRERTYNPFASALDDTPEVPQDQELYGSSVRRSFAIPSEILTRSPQDGNGAPFKIS
ncbi:hypothetical protein ACWD4V_16035 [Streptomyces tsukubensis]|uniref:hypothetical protein n=1 Tax=Streptomyces tsukubensis TaxID=83656 RepID=UPI00367613BB